MIFHVQIFLILTTFLLKSSLKQTILPKWEHKDLSCYFYVSFKKHGQEVVITQSKKRLSVQCHNSSITTWQQYRELHRF